MYGGIKMIADKQYVQRLQVLCDKRIYEIYGKKIPKYVENRLHRELKIISEKDCAEIFIVAERLVKSAREAGYVIGYRYNIGASFVAFLIGITEVNPLPAHYRCSKCFYTDFDLSSNQAYKGRIGWSLPERKCPVCGATLERDGFDIPFESFLGWNGNSELNIWLTFPWQYFDNIGSFASVYKLSEELGVHIAKETDEFDDVVNRRVKRNICILGCDKQSMIYSLQKQTGIDVTRILLDDTQVKSLFYGETGERIREVMGTEQEKLQMPEFGGEYVVRMLEMVNPQNFEELVRINGLSHGSLTWDKNAQELIKNGKADISTVISVREDIMLYLISRGINFQTAYEIMERVRKGKGLKPEWEMQMREREIEEWYIESCKKVRYVCSKAQAVENTIQAWRIAWYKVYYPNEYKTVCKERKFVIRIIKEG